jgi:hypothetical protein
MLLEVDAVSPNDPNRVQSLGEVNFGSERTQAPLVSRIRPWNRKDTRTLSDKHTQNLRDAKLGDYHSMVLVFNATSSTFVETHLLDDSRTQEVMSFLHLQVNEDSLADSNNVEFVQAQNWPSLEDKVVFAIAHDGSGKELGRSRIDLKVSGAADQAAAFLRQFAPPQKDAEQKWNEAFAEAKRSKRKVWARVSQRYCGPCFTFSRWLDNQHELLSKDYVFLKIDNLRDLNSKEVINRIVGDNSLGVPFHAIFDIDESMLIDSVSSEGNIGHPDGPVGKQHLQKMLSETSSRLTSDQLEQIVGSLKD